MYLRMVERAPRAADGWYNLGAIALELGQYGTPAMRRARRWRSSPTTRGRRSCCSAPALPTRGPRRRTCRKRRRSSAASARAPLLDAGRHRGCDDCAERRGVARRSAPLPHHYLANVYFLQGDLVAAARHEREAVRLAPDSELYSSNLRSLEAALAGSPQERQ